MKQECDQFMKTNALPHHITQVHNKSSYIENTETYLQSKKLPQTEFIRLGVNESFFREDDGNGQQTDELPHVNVVELLSSILDNDLYYELRQKVADAIQPGRYEYLMRACALMANNELNFSGAIELARFMTALKYLNSTLTADEVWHLASKSQCGNIETEEDKKVKYVSF